MPAGSLTILDAIGSQVVLEDLNYVITVKQLDVADIRWRIS